MAEKDEPFYIHWFCKASKVAVRLNPQGERSEGLSCSSYETRKTSKWKDYTAIYRLFNCKMYSTRSHLSFFNGESLVLFFGVGRHFKHQWYRLNYKIYAEYSTLLTYMSVLEAIICLMLLKIN